MLLRQISIVIGAASLAGCAVRSISDGGEGADEGSAASGDDPQSGEGESEGESESEDPVKFDMYEDPSTSGDPSTGDPTDTDGGEGCAPFIDGWDWQPPDSCGLPDGWSWAPICFVPPEGSSCEDEPYTDACILDGYSCGLATHGDSVLCGPYTTPAGACCYVVEGSCPVGRPFHVDGRARTAALVDGGAWSAAPRPKLAPLDAPTRAALADAWRRHGQSEHASIASFARFGSQLLALGAPAELVAASLRAGADERRHALRCFGLADAYAGRSSQPAALAVAAAFGSADDPVAIAVSLASEGCVAETVSLELLGAALAQAEDPAVRACLTETIADEREHVLLAWAALAWLCREFGEPVRIAVARVFGEAERHVGFGATTELPGEPSHMRAHGCLTIPERRDVAIRALQELVLPSARTLLTGRDRNRPAAPHYA